MSFSAHKTDSVIFKGIRPLPSTVADFYTEDYLQNEDKLRDRTCSIIHRGSSNSIISPSTSETQSQELQTYIPVVPTVFIYDRETVEEKCYESIEDIPAVKNNEGLWIDVAGVREIDLVYKKNLIQFE